MLTTAANTCVSRRKCATQYLNDMYMYLLASYFSLMFFKQALELNEQHAVSFSQSMKDYRISTKTFYKPYFYSHANLLYIT